MTSRTYKVKKELLDLYTDAGLTLFQLDGYTKKALRRGFKNTPFDPTLEVKDCNYGVLLNLEYLVIDVDKRSFQPEDDKPVSRLFEDIGVPLAEITKTFTVATPSGGYHIYFRKNPKVSIRGSLKEYPGVEFKQHFITAVGSYNEEVDKNYEVKRHSPGQIGSCPDKLLALLARKDIIDVEKEGLLSDHPSNVRVFTGIASGADPAVQGQGGDSRTFNIAALGKDKGLTCAKTYEIMLEHFNPRCQPPWSNEELEDKVKNAYEHGYQAAGCTSIENDFDDFEDAAPKTKIKARGWDTKQNGELKTTLHNTVQLLTFSDPKKPKYKPILKDLLKFNQFTGRIEFVMTPPWNRTTTGSWNDKDATQAKYHLSVNWKYDPSVNLVHEAVEIIAGTESYHPVRDWIRSLKWDKAPRLDTWLMDTCGAKDTKLNRFYGRKTLIAAVSRVFKPGCKFDHVLVLEGAQGIGKSSVCRILGSPWFTDSHIDVRNKDSIDLIQGQWIIELAEMYAVSQYEDKAMRRFITAQVDRCRVSYGRTAADFPRQCIFIGTVNVHGEGYLKDQENRRYWPVPIKQVNFGLLTELRNQLFAEAYVCYMKGEEIHVGDASIAKLAREEVEKRQVEDPWLHMIDDWIEERGAQYYDEKKRAMIIQPVDIFTGCLGGHSISFSPKEALRIAGVLRQLGFIKKQSRTHRGRKTYYLKPVDKLLDL